MKRVTRLAFLAALSLATTAWALGDDEAQQHRTRFGRLADLAGSCWSGVLDDGARDVHCWEWTLQGRFLRDRHTVRKGDEVYSGETLYAWNAASGVVEFWYFNSLGGMSRGTATVDGALLRFEESYEDSARTASIRSSLEMPDANRYVMVSERLAGESWRPFLSVAYERYGTRPATLGGPWSERWDLLFNSTRDGDYEVYRLDLRTGEARNLTNSPDTEWIYVGGDRPLAVSRRPAGAEPGYRLYRLDPASGELARLNDFPVADSWVAELPEGRGYVVCAVEAGDKELYLLDAGGAIERRLTDNEVDDCQPDVTPDGRTVVFWSNRSGNGELWSMPLAGGEARQLTRFAGNDGVPDHRFGGEGPPHVSPDGRSIVWMAMRGVETFDIYTMAIDGGGERRLTDHPADDGYPAWSPDGKWIAFDSTRYGSADLFVVRPDGSDLTRVTDHEGWEQGPVWVPRLAER